VLGAVVALAAGCENVEWNWQTDWWKEPRRVVRPTRQSPAPPSRANAAENRSAESVERRIAVEAGGGAPASSTARLTDSPVVSASASRAYYQLYLIAADAGAEALRGEQQVLLRHAKARDCGLVLEMLFVPLGRSGGEEECYLLYEDRGEFRAAVEFAPALDVPAMTTPGASIGPQEAFRAGVGLLLGMVGQGAIVDRPLIDAAERRLAEAAQAEPLELLHRWAAAILAGRVASEYRYDYAAARSYYSQADRLVPPESLHHFIALYWRADALALEGRKEESANVYGQILGGYGPRTARSELVRRAQSALRQFQKQ